MKKISLLLFSFIIFWGSAFAQSQKIYQKDGYKIIVRKPVYFDVSPPLRDMIRNGEKTYKPLNKSYREIENFQKEIVLKHNKMKVGEDPWAKLQREYWKKNGRKTETLQQIDNFDGVNNLDNGAPPDTQGDVSPNYYMQCVNNHTEIFDKSGNVVKSAFPTSDFWQGTGFDDRNDGDAVILWDEDAQRWLVSQFYVPDNGGDQYELVAISQTSDPTGSYYRYAFKYTYFPDYPKAGVWPDAYYFGFNAFDQNDNMTFKGVYLSAYERSKMLAGDASAQAVTILDPNLWSVFPADADVFPPAGTPGYFVHDQMDYDVGNHEVYIYKFTVDWATPSNSTFVLDKTIKVPDYSLFSGDAAMVPQPGTTQKLDLLHYRTMYRNHFRQFPDHKTLLMTRTVNNANDGTDGVAAVRWYEFRDYGLGWELFQSGTIDPGDGIWRWMPSIAINKFNDIALGYSVSDGNSKYPSIRVAIHRGTDPKGVITPDELEAYTGSDAQSGVSRWGDYSMVSVDPSDDYTFWFTTEYTTGSWNWRTRIIHYKLPEYGAPTVSSVSEDHLYKDRGKTITITGTNLYSCNFILGGIYGKPISNDGTTATVEFPPGRYTDDGTLTVENCNGSTTYTGITIYKRNTIPVVSGAAANSDDHPTVASAIYGLSRWYLSDAFNSGDLPGAKIIEIHAGTYTDSVSISSILNPTSDANLIFQNYSGDQVIFDATGKEYAFVLAPDYVTVRGLQIENASVANILVTGSNNTIEYNKITGAVYDGIRLTAGSDNTISHNFISGNSWYGIRVDGAANTNLINNTFYDNGDYYTHKTGITIYNEPFNDNSDWTTSDWSTCSGVSGSASGGNFACITNASDYITKTVAIDVSGYDNLTISLYARSYGTLESSDNFSAEYSFDGANWTQIVSLSDDHNTFTEYSVTGVSPTSNTLYLRAYGSCGSSEYWLLDDYKVVGDEAIADGNYGSAIYVASGTGTNLKNNIVNAKTGSNYYALQAPSGVTVTSDYNVYYTANTNLFDYNGTQDNTGPMGANDLNSDPLFVDAANGDFHISSKSGSYHGGEWPPLTATAGTWTNDGDDSPALDAGDPADAYSNEPESGNRINAGCYGNTVQASKSFSGQTYTWTGNNGNSNWSEGGNWDLGSVPTSIDNVVIPVVSNPYPVVDAADGLVECNNITINSGASLTIAPDGQLTVNSEITNDAGTSGLVIQSDATGTGSLIQNSTGSVQATVQRFLASTSKSWHLLSTPISDADIATVFPNTSDLYYYDESTDDYWTGSSYDVGSTSGWVNITSGTMTPAKGYAYEYFQTTLNFEGTLNSPNVASSVSISYTDNGATAPNGTSYNDYDGWNLIANPFTSAIDWTQVDAGAANLYDAIYVWDAANMTYKSWVNGTDSWDGASTNGGSQYIPAMQGFFVKVNESLGTSGTLNIPATARVHNTQAFWKSSKNIPDNYLTIAVSNRVNTDETVVRFVDGATENIDNHLDAYKLFSNVANASQIYTQYNGSEYSINTLPKENRTFEVPLKIKVLDGDFVVTFKDFNFSDYRVFLKDNSKETDNLTEITKNLSLEFNTTGNENDDRFVLIFEPKSVSAVSSNNDNTEIDFSLYPNPTDGMVWLRVKGGFSNYSLSIKTITGVEVYKEKFNGQSYHKITLTNLNAGIYIVNIKLDNGQEFNRRLIIK